MNLNTKDWKEFYLKDFFNITAGIYHYPNEYEHGTTPYVSASNENNGIGQKIDLPADFKGNCIVTGKVGCTAFYQPNDFCATSDVNIFYPKFKLNEKIGLFIVTIINFNENYKWSYGRQCRIGDSNEISIKLPANKKGEPDWDYMERYIESLNHKPLSTENRGGYGSHTLGIEKWESFRFGNLISSISKAKAHTKEDVNECKSYYKNAIPYVSRTEPNNSVDFYAENDDLEGIEKGNAIVIGDTTATISYQEKPFIAGDHIVVIRADWLNKYTGLFIVSILRKEQFRYSYGRAYTVDLINNTQIKLPTKNKKPDWDFMENYIKSLPYGDRI